LTIWGYCLMSNHFHLIAVPSHEDAAAKVLGRLEADFARYLNVRRRTSAICGRPDTTPYRWICPIVGGRLPTWNAIRCAPECQPRLRTIHGRARGHVWVWLPLQHG
jgi:putative transposase